MSWDASSPILHMSIEVTDLERSIDFYTSVLGCSPGRRRTDFADVWFFGCQLTLVRNESLIPPRTQFGPHIGAIVDDQTFRRLSRAVADHRAALVSPVTSAHAGTRLEQTKLMFRDPDGNRIELKTYADVDHALQKDRNQSEPASFPAGTLLGQT